MTRPRNELASGWACETHCGVYRFGHVAVKAAEKLAAGVEEEQLYVVVAINWTLASDEKTKHVHINHYFAISPIGAAGVALAVNHPNETIVEIRRATDEEASEYFDAWGHFSDRIPAAIPRTGGKRSRKSRAA